MPIDPATFYREQTARARVGALKTDIPLRRYVSGLARRHEILAGSEDTIINAVLRPAPQGQPRNHLEHLGVPAPERPAPLPAGNSHADLIARCQAFLDGPGACYLNPAHKPAEDELPLVAVARRFGMNKEDAERFYLDQAVKLAGRTGASLAQGVFHALTTVAEGRYLGVEPPAANPEPEPPAAPAPTWRPGDSGGVMIAGQFYANPNPEPTPPPTAASRHLESIRSGV